MSLEPINIEESEIQAVVKSAKARKEEKMKVLHHQLEYEVKLPVKRVEL